MKSIWAGVWMVSLGSLGSACVPSAEVEQAPDDVSVGRLAISVVPFMGTDVVAIKVKIVPGSSSCSAMAVQEKTGLIRPDVTLAPAHPVTDAFFVLPPGSFRACLTPVSDAARGTPSATCGPVDGVTTIMSGSTTELSLISQCKGDPRGGLDVLAALNRPPTIDDLNMVPSKLALVDHDVVIKVSASDPDRDSPLTFTFSQVSGPSTGTLTPNGANATFRASVAGTYELRVTVSDGKGGQTALIFPIILAG
jgi:hypothetical protein